MDEVSRRARTARNGEDEAPPAGDGRGRSGRQALLAWRRSRDQPKRAALPTGLRIRSRHTGWPVSRYRFSRVDGISSARRGANAPQPAIVHEPRLLEPHDRLARVTLDVGAEVERPARREQPEEQRRHAIVDEPPPLVSPLPPGIREVHVERGERPGAEQARREDARVPIDHDEVPEGAPLRLRRDLTRERAPLLDRDERPVRVRSRELEREPAVATADLELQPGGARAETRGPVGHEIERDRGVVFVREDHERACLAW